MGAALLFSQIKVSDVGKAVICVLVAQTFRFVAVLLATTGKQYTIKERVFFAISFIPKSTTAATVAAVVYNDAVALGEDYQDYQLMGLQIQTTTIIAILITMFLGIFMIDFFGPRLLTHEEKQM